MTCPSCLHRIGRNRDNCWFCREYYELTSDYGRELIDKEQSNLNQGEA